MPEAGRAVASRAWWTDPRLLARATRFKTAPLILLPVALGASFAAMRGAPMRWGWFALTLFGAAALHLGANVLNDFYDERSGADGFARLDKGSIATGSGLIAAKKMTPRAMLALAGVLWGVALAAGIAIGLARAPGVIWLGALGALLAHQYVAPPLRLGYRGLGEPAIFLCYGVLPVCGSYVVQTLRFDAAALWASVVPAMLTTLVFFHHHFLHWRADRTARKMTPVAVLGPERAIVLSGIGIIAAYVVLTLQVAFELFPAWALLGLVTAPPVAAAWARAARDSIVQNCLGLLGATLGASAVTQVILVAVTGFSAWV